MQSNAHLNAKFAACVQLTCKWENHVKPCVMIAMHFLKCFGGLDECFPVVVGKCVCVMFNAMSEIVSVSNFLLHGLLRCRILGFMPAKLASTSHVNIAVNPVETHCGVIVPECLNGINNDHNANVRVWKAWSMNYFFSI